MSSTLIAHNLQIGYTMRNREFRAGPFSFSLEEGELVMLIGPNGIGKSTLLRTLVKLNLPLSGEIILYDRSIKNISQNEMARYVAFVSTETNFPFYLSVYDLVALGRIPYLNWMGRLTTADKRIVEQAIELMQLGHLKHKSLQEVSDGERQKALIARALAQDSPFIFLDEPTAFLDIVNKHKIIHQLCDIAHNQKKAVLLTTHDLNIALSEADKLLVMLPDQFLTGAPEDLQLKNQLNTLFKHQFQFDPVSGTLKRHRTMQHKVIVQVHASVPRTVIKLTQKAIERIGYEVIEVTDSGTFPKIILHRSNNEYHWDLLPSHDGARVSCSNLYMLCRSLGNLQSPH